MYIPFLLPFLHPPPPPTPTSSTVKEPSLPLGVTCVHLGPPCLSIPTYLPPLPFHSHSQSHGQVQLGVLFAMYAAPNTFMPVAFAVLASSQRLLWRLVLGLVFFICAGGCLAYAGVVVESYLLVLAGRLRFGVSSESYYGASVCPQGCP